MEEGTVRWFEDQATLVLPNGVEIPYRITGLLHKEENEWKMVQCHNSIGIDNVETVGEELDV